MAWYLNHYKCARCNREWTDEWSCMCDDDCPHCGARHMSPYESDDLTMVVEKIAGKFFVRRSPESAGHTPDYVDLATFSTLKRAEAFRARIAEKFGNEY